MSHPVEWVFPRDIIAGLGCTPREQLATFLALLEESTPLEESIKLFKRYKNRLDSSLGWQKSEYITAVQERQRAWQTSELQDDELKILLWIALREIFKLPPRISHSIAGCSSLADDLVATIIHHKYKPESLSQKLVKGFQKQDQAVGLPPTLQSIVLECLEVLKTHNAKFQSEPSINDGEDVVSEKTLADAHQWLATQTPQQLAALASLMGVEKVNENALGKFMAGAGAITTFSAGVSLAGFSAYILAAQASAFIPLVSGPGLVSAVAVLANPLTVGAGVVGGGWWAYQSTKQKMRAIVATQVISLLALQGVFAGPASLRRTASAFIRTSKLRENIPLVNTSPLVGAPALNRYRQMGADLSAIPRLPASTMADEQLAHFDARLRGQEVIQGSDKQDAKQNDKRDVLALSALTVGDALYAYAIIDPAVVSAADFAYKADITDTWGFAWLANNMADKTAKAALGEETRLKGYVGEQMVASHLAAQGHAVSFPASSWQTDAQ